MTPHYHWQWVDTFQGGRNIDIHEDRNHIAITFTEEDAKRIISALRNSSVQSPIPNDEQCHCLQSERDKVLNELLLWIEKEYNYPIEYDDWLLAQIYNKLESLCSSPRSREP